MKETSMPSSSCDVTSDCESREMCPKEPSVVRVCSIRHQILALKGKAKYDENPEKPMEEAVP